MPAVYPTKSSMTTIASLAVFWPYLMHIDVDRSQLLIRNSIQTWRAMSQYLPYNICHCRAVNFTHRLLFVLTESGTKVRDVNTARCCNAGHHLFAAVAFAVIVKLLE